MAYSGLTTERSNFMLSLDKSRYVHAIWFAYVENPEIGGVNDVLAELSRPIEGGEWTFSYRFRYSDEADNSHSEDQKSWYSGKMSADTPMAKVEEAVNLLFVALRETTGKNVVVCPIFVKGDGEKAMQLLMKQPWCHLTQLQKGGSA